MVAQASTQHNALINAAGLGSSLEGLKHGASQTMRWIAIIQLRFVCELPRVIERILAPLYQKHMMTFIWRVSSA